MIGICACHLLHDGLSDVLYIFLPFWYSTFGISHAQAGFAVMLYYGAMGVFQIPAGILAERLGERLLLVLGTTISGLGFLVLALADGFTWLVAILLVVGLGSAVQHPLGAALVSRTYDSGRRRVAIGTFNFAGDLGKMLFPTLAGLALLSMQWPVVTTGIGIITITGAVCLYIVLRRLGIGDAQVQSDSRQDVPAPRRRAIRNRQGFRLLAVIGGIDMITRYAFLTLLPFLLIERGLSKASVGMALGLLFAGGAAGKFLCGHSAQRFGVLFTVWLTEAVTCGGILVLLIVPTNPAIVLLPVIGAALNGTSSVLYGSVADFAVPERQARAFGIFYTVVITSGSVAPAVFGKLSDVATVDSAMVAIALIALITIPLARQLDRHIIKAHR